MQTGKVKFFNESKGDETNQEIFVNVTGLGGAVIRENDSVSFETTDGKKGLNAVNVRKLS